MTEDCDFVSDHHHLYILREGGRSFYMHGPSIGISYVEWRIPGTWAEDFVVPEQAIDIELPEADADLISLWYGRWVDEVAANGMETVEDYGNVVVIEHQYGYLTLYGHLEEALVTVDEEVESGQIIGRVGETGRTTGPHLHFEIRRGNDRLNPDDIPHLFTHQARELSMEKSAAE